MLKNQEGKPWTKTLENLIFCIISTALTKTEVEGAGYFIF